jgi:hypothetical protein
LLNQLRTAYQEQLQTTIPAGLVHRFDNIDTDSAVQKTTHRQVITLGFSSFRAVDVRRTTPAGDPVASPLDQVVPKGGTYGYDLIAHVGCQTFLHGRKLEDVAQELPRRIPFSSLYDVQQKFLFYFGHLHRQSAGRLRDYFEQRGGSSWLIDATIEPDTPMYFGVYDSQDDILLNAWKIPSENVDFIRPCLQEAVTQFGCPKEVMHDLSDAMHAACNKALENVPQRVCHFHLLRDIGEDLLSTIHARLRDRARQLKLHARLKEQRKGQTEWLRQHLEERRVLSEVLHSGLQGVPSLTLGREILLAFHQWILDFPHDGHRQGFPFDPYLLYFHRRVVRASALLERLLGDEGVRRQTPQVLTNFAQLLRQYLSDPQVVDAARQFEAAFEVFSRLRSALRLTARGDNPARQRYLLDDSQVAAIRQSVSALREEYRQQALAAADESLRGPYRIVVEHLDRYWDYLFPSVGTDGRERTTNGLESCWGANKRRCRKRHGRKKLSRDFRSLPADFMLVGNLANPVYVQIVLGEMSFLPTKLAEAGSTAGPWTHWRSQHHPLNIGHLSRRLLRSENFIDKLVAVYDDTPASETASPPLVSASS